MTWGTDTEEFRQAVEEFEAKLPGWWWSVGQCSVGAHASCAVDGNSVAAHLLIGIPNGHPFDGGFHCDTRGGQPHEALRDVMRQAVEFLGETAPTPFEVLPQRGDSYDRSAALADAIEAAIDRETDHGPLAPAIIIGTLEVVKSALVAQMIMEATE